MSKPSTIYDRIDESIEREGPASVWRVLAQELRQVGEFHRLFEALNLAAKHRLGLPLVQRAAEISDQTRRQWEDAIVESSRDVGNAFLAEGDIPSAFQYFDMIGEPMAVRVALERCQPNPQDVGPIVEIAVHRGVHPTRGIELVIEHFGLCQAISTCEGLAHSQASSGDIEQATGIIARHLHEQLMARLVQEMGSPAPAHGEWGPWLDQNPSLFEDDNYHVDPSHLNAVVRMVRFTLDPRLIELATDLCEYGARLSKKYHYADVPPFEDLFGATRRCLELACGKNLEENLAYFRAKADAADPREVGLHPREVFLRLLKRSNRAKDALEYADTQLNEYAGVFSNVINEICQSAGDFDAMAKMALKRRDPVSYAVAVINRHQCVRSNRP